jgi:CheY-like chemotaxis protein
LEARSVPIPLVVIVDADEQRAQRLAEGLVALGYRAFVTSSPLDALVAIEEQRPQVVVLRWRVPEEERGSVIDSDVMLRARTLALPLPPAVIALVDSAEDAADATYVGAQVCLPSATDTKQLLQKLDDLLHQLGVVR